jgi:hypothetical protein
MFRSFPIWPSSGWSTMSEEPYTYCNTIISVSVSTQGGGGDEISFTKSWECVQTVGGN